MRRETLGGRLGLHGTVELVVGVIYNDNGCRQETTLPRYLVRKEDGMELRRQTLSAPLGPSRKTKYWGSFPITSPLPFFLMCRCVARRAQM